MNGILGVAQLLQTTELDGEQQELVVGAVQPRPMRRWR